MGLGLFDQLWTCKLWGEDRGLNILTRACPCFVTFGEAPIRVRRAAMSRTVLLIDDGCCCREALAADAELAGIEVVGQPGPFSPAKDRYHTERF